MTRRSVLRNLYFFWVAIITVPMASGAVAYSGTQTNSYVYGVSPFTIPITVSGSNPVLVLHLEPNYGSNNATAVSWSLGSGTAVNVATASYGNNYANVNTWCIPAPTAGSGTVSVTTATGVSAVWYDLELWTGASQTAPCPTGDAQTWISDGSSSTITLTPTHLATGDATVGNSGTCVDDSNAMTPNSIVHYRGGCDLDTGYNTNTSGITASFTSSTQGLNGAVAIRIVAASSSTACTNLIALMGAGCQ